ncbi:MAG: lactate utilization protein C [Betaproteobacteria bacterium]|nr:lactate utilization protein C [Betaproteobacteria bacterium]
MSARDEILGRVRRGLGKGDAAGRRAKAEALLAAPVRGPQPAIGGELVARFVARAESLTSTVSRVAAASEVPASVAAWLAAQGLDSYCVATADVGDLPWSAAGIAAAVRSAQDADMVGITGCYCAIAETGTLILLSGPETPASVSLLPETHVAVVPAERVVATMEDAFALLRSERPGFLPRAVNLVSGPSRTGDIEQTIVLGAHGPCRVHIVIVGDAPAGAR